MKKTLIITLLSFIGYNSNAQLYFNEGFSGLAFGEVPAGWDTLAIGVNNTTNWIAYDVQGDLAPGSMYLQGQSADTTETHEDYLVSPEITILNATDSISFSIIKFYSPRFNDIEIRVSTTYPLDTAFTTILSVNDSTLTSGWNTLKAPLAGYEGQAIRIAIVNVIDTGRSQQGYLLDDFIVGTETCFKPTNLVASMITNEGALVNWSGDGANYEVSISEGLYDDLSVSFQTTMDSSLLLTGLRDGLRVVVRAREICAVGDTSNWSVDFARFTTLCDPVTTSLPYYNDFETGGESALTCGWARENDNSDASFWGGYPSFDTTGVYGDYAIFTTWDDNNDKDDWYISPEFNLVAGTLYELGISFKGGYILDSVSYLDESFSIMYGNGQTSADLTNLIGEITGIYNRFEFTDTTISFTPTVTGNYNIGFHSTSPADYANIWIDNFSLRIDPSNSLTEKSTNNFKIYPNPNNGIFLIENISSSAFDIQIVDVQGKTILEKKNISGNSVEKINLSQFNSGVYFVNIVNETAISNTKIIIK